jgi:hypothetical protein
VKGYGLGDGAGKDFEVWGRIKDTGRTNKEERAHGWRKMERNGKEIKEIGWRRHKIGDGRKLGQKADVES